MAKRPKYADLKPALILDGIKTEKELTKIITKIVDELIKEESMLRHQLDDSDYSILEDSISKFAWQAELKIQIKEVQKIKRSVLAILKKSTNQMILATIELGERIN